MFTEKLPDNMAFLAACNPYALKDEKIAKDDNVGIKHSKSNQN